MRSLPGTLICVTTLFMLTSQALAGDFQGGIQFVVGVPQGEFKENINRNGYGISGQVGHAPQRAPFMVGVEFSYLNYGSERRAEPFSTTIPDVTVDVENSNNIVLAHLALRLQPNTGFFQPYAEGVVGLNYLFTTTQSRTGEPTGAKWQAPPTRATSPSATEAVAA